MKKLKKFQLQKILIINIFGLGDVLFTTPLISNLKRLYPNCSIGYVCNGRAQALMEGNPHIDHVFVYEKDDFRKLYKHSKKEFIQKSRDLFDDIKKQGYDTVFDISLNRMAGLFCQMMGIKHRIGFNYKNRGRFLNYTIPLKGYDDKPVAEYYLDLLRLVSSDVQSVSLSLDLRLEDKEWVGSFLKRHDIDEDQDIVGIAPGGGESWGKDADLKRWSVENYAKIADKIIENSSVRIILLGSQKEKDLCDTISSLMKHPSFSACGQTTLTQFAALTRRCSFVILNDGGPLHMAVASGARTVSIFGRVDERVYGPYPSDSHIVVTKNIACRPCYRQFRSAQCDHMSCLRDITVDEVFSALRSKIQYNTKTLVLK